MNEIKKLAEQTAVYGLSSIVGRFLNFLLVPLFTRVFIPQEYGIVTELYAYVVFLLIFLTYGMETGYFRFVQNEENRYQVFPTIISSLFITSSLFIILIIVFIKPIAKFLQYQQHIEYIILLSIIVAIDAFVAVPFAKLRQKNKAFRFAVIKIMNISLNVIFNLIFLILFPYLNNKYNIQFIQNYFIKENMVIYVFISNLIASVFTLILLLPEIFDEKLSFNTQLFKKIFYYSFPLLLAGLAGQTNEVLDRILLKYFITVPREILNSNEYIMSQIGIYGANFKLVVIMSLFIQAFRYAFEPMFFNKGKSKDSKIVYARIMKYFIIFCLVIFLLITLFIDFFKYFIGSDFHQGLKIVPIVLFAYIFLGILYNLSLWYKLNDLTKFGLVIACCGAVVTIILNIILIPKYGYMGSAWTHLICYFIMISISYYFMTKHFYIKYDLFTIFIYFLVVVILYFVSKFLHIGPGIFKYLVHSILLLSFIIFVLIKENLLYQIIGYARKNRK